MTLNTVSRSDGSSPLTRGKPRCRHPRRNPRRLIPAHAGKTVDHVGVHRVSPAHPRSRGENMGSGPCACRSGGSSPLTRGKQTRALDACEGVGLIPAHAGKTAPRATPASRAPAHPRSRGENRLVYWPTREMMGSSPLTRGKPPLVATDLPERGLIPAHAGKTLKVAQIAF